MLCFVNKCVFSLQNMHLFIIFAERCLIQRNTYSIISTVNLRGGLCHAICGNGFIIFFTFSGYSQCVASAYESESIYHAFYADIAYRNSCNDFLLCAIWFVRYFSCNLYFWIGCQPRYGFTEYLYGYDWLCAYQHSVFFN